MPYFFSNENLSLNTETEITGEEARHILLAHRAKKGERVKLQSPDKKRFQAEILSANKGVVRLKVLELLKSPLEPDTELILYQAFVSEKALDFVLQKGTELGVTQIVLFNSQNTAQKFSKEKFETKVQRWKKVVQEAAKQSERSLWPEIKFYFSFQEVIKELGQIGIVYLADTGGNEVKKEMLKTKKVGVVVGPEGGLTETEAGQLKQLSNCKPIKLSNFILRAETASLAAVSIIRNMY